MANDEDESNDRNDCSDDGDDDRGDGLAVSFVFLADTNNAENEGNRQENPADNDEAGDAGENRAEDRKDQGDKANGVARWFLRMI
ncbi:hypothetical protein [Schaalia sp. ZJ405]|uniref:hypothetical protein n=1 Tax=Schaalia sp. ZJ405 TaxID=2709403 RepID=UPI001E342ECD|nr:hypothetical protein [Schaalia sp. ZJ405]